MNPSFFLKIDRGPAYGRPCTWWPCRWRSPSVSSKSSEVAISFSFVITLLCIVTLPKFLFDALAIGVSSIVLGLEICSNKGDVSKTIPALDKGFVWSMRSSTNFSLAHRA